MKDWKKSIVDVSRSVVVLLSVLVLVACTSGGNNGNNGDKKIPTGWQIRIIKNAKNRNAVCNDGTMAVYYIRQATSPDVKDQWIVYLQGGGSCRTIEECNARKKSHPQWMTSKIISSNTEISTGGIMSKDAKKNPDFHNVNWVFVPYCSSDGWIGNRAASQETGGNHFRGRSILKAVIEDLSTTSENRQQTLKDAKRVLFAGTSAGASGVRHLIDEIANMLPGINIKGLADSAWQTTAPALGKTWEETYTDIKKTFAFWGASLNKACVSKESIPERCVYSETLMKYTKTPLFHDNDQKDEFALSNAGIPKSAQSQEAQKARAEYGQRVRTELAKLKHSFSPSTGAHGLCFNKSYFELKVKGLTLQQTFTNWYFERDGSTQAIAAP
jgi:hypothetical protein